MYRYHRVQCVFCISSSVMKTQRTRYEVFKRVNPYTAVQTEWGVFTVTIHVKERGPSNIKGIFSGVNTGGAYI